MKQILPSWWKSVTATLLIAVIAGVFLWWSVSDQKTRKLLSTSLSSGESNHSQSAVSQNASNQSLLDTNSKPVLLVSETNAAPMEEWRQKLIDRREFAQRLQKESAGELLSRLETIWGEKAIRAVASEEKTLVTMALTHALHSGDENSNAAVYQKLSALLKDDTLPFAAKIEIASILGSVQTPQSVQILLEAYQLATDDKLRVSLGNEIARTGDDRVAGQFRGDLSSPLESAWSLAKDDPKLAQSIANGLAKVGTAAGVQLLINEVLRSVQTVEGLADIKDIQSQAAFTSLDKVRNSNAVEGLATGLLNANSSEVQRYISGMTLAAMGKIDATEVLLKWAVTASDQEAVWAEQWFGKLRDTASFDLVAAALSSTNQINFNSAAIRNAVVLGQGNRNR